MGQRTIGKAEAIERLSRQAERAEELKSGGRKNPEFKKWHRDTEVLIEKIFGEESRHVGDFTAVRYHPAAYMSSTPDSFFEQVFRKGLDSARQILASLVTEIEEYWTEGSDDVATAIAPLPLSRLERLADRFHLAARQARSRHADRPTIDVCDEYDVQDLLHVLLTVDFDDIRREEWNPSYAGASSRSDFLLRDHGIVVEVKKTRRGLVDKQVGEQLIIDRARYAEHPHCDALVCFVYDPEGLVANPRGLESDLSGVSDGLSTTVIVAP